MAKAELAWLAVDIDNDLSPDQLKLYREYEAAKAAFEAKMLADAQAQGIVKAGQALAFAFRRGLAIAIVQARAQVGWSSLQNR